MINEVTILWSNCGCGISYYEPANPITSPYVTYDSDKNVFSDNYKPYVAYDSDNKFYVPYNYDADMAQTPVKFDEIDEIPDIDDLAKIIGVTSDGVDIVFTPSEFADYVIEQTTLIGVALIANITTVLNPDDTLYNEWFGTHNVQELVTNNQVYLRGYDFTTSGGYLTFINGGSWTNNQPFRAKI